MANPYVNKVVIAGTTKLDLTGDTITAGDLRQGITAHDKTGSAIVGTYEGGGGGELKQATGTVNMTAGSGEFTGAITGLAFKPVAVYLQGDSSSGVIGSTTYPYTQIMAFSVVTTPTNEEIRSFSGLQYQSMYSFAPTGGAGLTTASSVFGDNSVTVHATVGSGNQACYSRMTYRVTGY